MSQYAYAKIIFRLLNDKTDIALTFSELNKCWQSFIARLRQTRNVLDLFAKVVGEVTGNDLFVAQIRERLVNFNLTESGCQEFRALLPPAQPMHSFMSWAVIHRELANTRLRERDRWRLQHWCVQTDAKWAHLKQAQQRITGAFFRNETDQFLQSIHQSMG